MPFAKAQSGGLNDPLFTPNGTHSFVPPPPPPTEWPKRWNPWQMRTWYILLLASIYTAFAIGIEVAYSFSVKQKGFSASDSPWRLTSTQFLKSFLPVLVIVPLAYSFRKHDEFNRLIQPYVDLQQGSATAERSLLLSYVLANPIRSTIRGLGNQHKVIVISTWGMVLAMVLQPLAGSLFTIRPTEMDLENTSIALRTQLGLVPGFENLEPFVSAAGYADAAAFHGLADPPFVRGTWAVTEFDIPTELGGKNGSAVVKTVGIKSDPRCEAPYSQTFTRPDGTTTGNYTLTADFSSCKLSVFVDPTNGDFAGVQPAPPCADNGPDSVDDTTAPAAFFYFLSGSANASIVLCKPKVQVFNVFVIVNATTNDLEKTDPIDTFPTANNVSTLLEKGAYSGIAFGPWISNPLVQARALAIQSQLPSAGLKLARKIAGGPGAVMQDAEGFTKITSLVYTQYLALVAKSIYFQPVDVNVSAQMKQWQPRLWLDPLPCHGLAAVLLTMAILLLVDHFMLRSTRNKIYLGAEPGNLASAIALTSNSQWTAMLTPADDRDSISRKLRGLRFQLDPVSHHIIVEGEAIGQPRNAVPANSPILDKRFADYNRMSAPLTPMSGKESFGAGQYQMGGVPHAGSPIPSPMPSPGFPTPQSGGFPPGEAQGLLTPTQRAETYTPVTGYPPFRQS